MGTLGRQAYPYSRLDSIHDAAIVQFERPISIHCASFSDYGLIVGVAKISEAEFARICDGIRADREKIIEHNPIGTPEEILLWMLLSVLVSYLSLSEIETPCFTGRPEVETYRDAIHFILKQRKREEFDVSGYLNDLINPVASA